MVLTQHITITERPFDGYYDRHDEWVEPHTRVHDGDAGFHVVGNVRGSDLYVFMGRCDVTDLLDPDVTDARSAIAWCWRMLGHERPESLVAA